MSELAAYHEAGHAFMAFHVGARIRRVTLEPEWDEGPAREADIQIEWPVQGWSEAVRRVKLVEVALAGPVAEMHYRGEPFHPGFIPEWAADWQLAWQAASSLHSPNVLRLRYLENVTRQVYQQLDQAACWAAVSAVADSLLAHETLESEEVEEILTFWSRP